MADKVLIVDDDPAICKLLEKVMLSNDLIPTVVTCGKDALSVLKTHTFDIILMDVMLGDMEGFSKSSLAYSFSSSNLSITLSTS